MGTTNKPLKTIRVGNIKAAVWANKSENDRIYHSVSMSRSYKDGDDWKESTVFGRDDLPRLELATRNAFEFIHLQAEKSQGESFVEKLSDEDRASLR